MPDRQELMSIGDSCYNGVRSLTINAPLATQSVPAQVARAFGWPFVIPDYPRRILFDLEAIARNIGSIGNFRQIILDNAREWANPGAWSSLPTFDNIAVAQMTISDLSMFTYNNHVGTIQTLVDRIANSSSLQTSAIVDLYFAINGSFLLNPSHDETSPLASMAPLDVVADRRPKRLLVNIGINDGIWEVCLSAKKAIDSGAIMAAMQDLGDRLVELRTAGAVDRIYFNLLPKPSVVANLMPRANPDRCPPTSGYYPEYLGRLGQVGGLSGTEMASIDAEVETLNTAIQADFQERFAAIGGLHFVDIYDVMAGIDDKHCRETTPVRVNHGSMQWHLTNRPLQSFGGFVGGGLFGLDNLHPSTVGYSSLAKAVCDKISAVEGINPTTPIEYQSAFDADTLLEDVPGLWDIENLVLDLAFSFVSLRRFRQALTV
jgi:lysophospholipase L1-like esterase